MAFYSFRLKSGETIASNFTGNGRKRKYEKFDKNVFTEILKVIKINSGFVLI
jgi:hypothetical protein